MLYELVHSKPSDSLVETIENVHHGALSNNVTGLAYVALLRGGKYTVNWAGSVNKRPTLTIGGLMRLARQLDDLIGERDPEETR